MKLWEGIINAIFVVTKSPSISITKPITGTGYVNPKWQLFADQIRVACQQVERDTGIPWLFAVIQAGHESRHGESRLSVEAKNLFGFTGDSWYTEGKPVYWIMTTEYAKDKTKFETKRPFRKYDSWDESIKDWASLIVRRYPAALAAARKNDFEGFAKGLQAGGYATDPQYATQLVRLHKDLEGLA